jgi:tetratricopeptide (TPR) repeat protein
MAEHAEANDWFKKGLMHLEHSRYDEAIEAFEKAIEINPRDADAWYNKGIILAKKDVARYDGAVDCFDVAIHLDPNNAELWYNKGIALGCLGKYSAAIKAFDDAIRIESNDAKIWCSKGVALRGLERYDDAIEALDKAIEIDPEYADALDNKAMIVRLLSHKDGNAEAFEKDKRQNWIVLGYDVFSNEYYHISRTCSTEEEALKEARKYLEELEELQPSKDSGGQSVGGIQDHVFIVSPEGVRTRVT